MSMKTQFDNPLVLSEDGHTIRATGKFDWGTISAGDKQECNISVVLMQGSVSGSANAGDYKTGDHDWDCEVPAANGAQWHTGPLVGCIGTVTVTKPPEPAPWPPQAVSLQSK